MTREVSFDIEITSKSQITIYDENDNAVEDYKLFSNIIDSIGFALDFETTYEDMEHDGKKYKIVVENATEEKQYVGLKSIKGGKEMNKHENALIVKRRLVRHEHEGISFVAYGEKYSAKNAIQDSIYLEEYMADFERSEMEYKALVHALVRKYDDLAERYKQCEKELEIERCKVLNYRNDAVTHFKSEEY
jgi:hypothetical protein